MDIAIISGASSGIGKCFALLLDSYELDEIWLIGRSHERLCELTKELTTHTRLFALDLQDTEAFGTIAKELSREISIKFLVCSAGVGYNGNFDTLSLEEISNMSDTNCRALTLLNRLCLPYMAKGGRIINISSGAGFLPQPGFGVYAATKAYVTSFSRGLYQEVKCKGISVTAVCPGPVDTAFFSGLKDVKEYKRKFLVSPMSVAEAGLKASLKGRAVSTPTFSMKLVRFASKVLPSSLVLKFYK